MRPKRTNVFVNVPFDEEYRPLFGALIGCLTALHFVVFDSEPHRFKRTLSDLAGHDAQIHQDTPAGIAESVSSVFVHDLDQDAFIDVATACSLLPATIKSSVYRPNGYSRLVRTAREVVSEAGLLKAGK